MTAVTKYNEQIQLKKKKKNDTSFGQGNMQNILF